MGAITSTNRSDLCCSGWSRGRPGATEKAASRGFLEVRLLAGVWRSAESDAVFHIEPADFDSESTCVSLRKAGDNNCVRKDLTFDLTACSLRDGDGREVMRLSLSENLTRLLPVQGSDPKFPALLRTGPLAGASLLHPPLSDPAVTAALGGKDFLHEDLRDLSAEEMGRAADAAQLSGPSEAPSRSEPRILIVIAPSAGGKTTCVRAFCGHFGMNVAESVHADSAVFRDFLAPYNAIIQNGIKNNGIWFRAWPSHKPGAVRAKELLHKRAMDGRKDIIVSNTGSNVKGLLKEIESYKASGYLVNVLCIFADLEEIRARGVSREVADGKRYLRDCKKHAKTFDAFAPAVSAANGTFRLVRNSTGRAPMVYKEGKGGDTITFNLKEALQ